MNQVSYLQKAYEAPYVTKWSILGLNGMGHDHVFVYVDENFLRAANLTEEPCVLQAEVQFEMNRSPFCNMHFAVDQASPNVDLLFPTSAKTTRHKEFDLKT